MEPVSVLVAQAENTSDNHYKFYHVYITEHVGLVTWGRIGTAGQQQWVTPEEANHRWETKLRSGGYHEVSFGTTLVYPEDDVSDPDLAEVVQQHLSGGLVAASRRTAAWTQDRALDALRDVRDALDAAGLGRPDNGLNGAEMTGLTEAVGSVGFAIAPNRQKINGWDSGPYLQWNIVIDGITAGVRYEDTVLFDGAEGHEPVDADKLIPQIESAFRSLGWDVIEVRKTGHQLVWDHDIDFGILTEDPDKTARRAMKQRRVAIDVPELNGIYTAWDGTEVPISVTEDGTVLCAWFAGCMNPATDIADHPVLCEVPVCAEHYEFAKGGSVRESSRMAGMEGWEADEIGDAVVDQLMQMGKSADEADSLWASYADSVYDDAEDGLSAEEIAEAWLSDDSGTYASRRRASTGWTQEDGPIYSFNEQVWAQRYIGNDEPYTLSVDTDTGTMLFLGIVHDEEVVVDVDDFAYGDAIPSGEPMLDWITNNVLTQDTTRGNTTWIAPIKGYGS